MKRLIFTLVFFSLLIANLIWNHALAQTEQYLIGMPFTGKWAYNAKVNPPYTDSNSSHPSVHKTDSADKYDWATDLYALPDTPVKINIKNFGSGDTLVVTNVSDTSCGAGKRVRVLIKNSAGQEIGWVQYEHLQTSLKNNEQISNGTVLGVTKNWKTLLGRDLSCYVAKNDSSVHIHVSFKNSLGNFSCYVDHGNPGAVLNESESFGVIGSNNVGKKQSCVSLPSMQNLNKNSTKPTTGTGGTNVIPLGKADSNIQGSSGNKVQKTTQGKNIQGTESTKPSQKQNQDQTSQNNKTSNGIVSKVVNFFKNIFNKDKEIEQTVEVKKKTVASETKPASKPTSSAPAVATPPLLDSIPEQEKEFDDQGCPVGEPSVEITNMQILGYYNQKEYEAFSGSGELLLVFVGKLNNPTAKDIEIRSVGLYRENENTDFPPLLNLSVSQMELSNRSTTIKAKSSVDFKAKKRALWYDSKGTLTKNISPTLTYPAWADSKPQVWWNWVGTPTVSEKCQPNYYQE